MAVETPEDAIISLDDSDEKKESYEDFSNLQGLVKERFIKSEDARLFEESRWLR